MDMFLKLHFLLNFGSLVKNHFLNFCPSLIIPLLYLKSSGFLTDLVVESLHFWITTQFKNIFYIYRWNSRTGEEFALICIHILLLRDCLDFLMSIINRGLFKQIEEAIDFSCLDFSLNGLYQLRLLGSFSNASQSKKRVCCLVGFTQFPSANSLARVKISS